MNDWDRKTVETIRCLSGDMVQRANSGHPGLPLGAAPVAYTVWAKMMHHSAKHSAWMNRDRFILSGGHGSSLLYSLLHLYEYGLDIEDLRQFRQLDSLTPGHPEYGHTPGVDATTGPLGAGLAMAVGMAMAETHLASVFNTKTYPIFDHYTYVLAGDGCFMEGISSEALSLAGTLKLDKLMVLYDSNKISIEGDTDIAFQENVAKRMEAFGFATYTVHDGNNLEEIEAVLKEAKANTEKPSFIEVHTVIGKGCPNKEGLASAHGEPLGADNIKALKENLGMPVDKDFYVPDEVYQHIQKQIVLNDALYDDWHALFEAYCQEFPEKAKLLDQYYHTDYKTVMDQNIEYWKIEDKDNATRNISGSAMQKIKDMFPNFIGGSADLSPSTKTYLQDAGDYSSVNYAGRNIHYGVRELAMAAIGNGIALHGGLKTFVSTFFVFSDYVKPMARLSALMQLPLVYVLTHDSIGVGEDGPTHQPVEQLTMLRAMPNMYTIRPCDGVETNTAWYQAMISKNMPVSIVLSRQNLPQLPGSTKEGAMRGGYIIDDCKETPEVIIIASGSEVSLAIEAKKRIDTMEIRVVSMPCMEIFKEQDRVYQEQVLPRKVTNRIIIEAGSSVSWGAYAGLDGKYITMDSFGASAPASQVFEKFGFTVENVVANILAFTK